MKRYRLVVAANDILSDPSRRRAYDLFGAGWSTHPDNGGSACSSDHTTRQRWSGFHDNNSPAGNATWEDWEKWHQRNSRGAQAPVYTSNGGFVSLVAFVVALSAMSQASRVDEHQQYFADRIELVHNDCHENIQRRKDGTKELSSADLAILRFMRSREQGGTNTYVIGAGPRRILIDTGEGKASWSQHILSLLSSERTTISDALVTHWHPDHVGGIADLLSLCPQARIYKHNAAEGQFHIDDAQRFGTDGATLRAFHCPGHTTDHMAFVLEEEDAMFTGDNVLGHGTAVFEDLRTYMTSLKRMQNQFSSRAYPGHGSVIEDGPMRVSEYIEHRHQRQHEVLSVLAQSSKTAQAVDRAGKRDDAQADSLVTGEMSPMEIVKVVYQDVPENLHTPAAGGVVQVLQMLAEEGKVVQSADHHRWRIMEDSGDGLSKHGS
ncbi:MAG: hypothetical protein Q9210_000159 [Variospora velana]